MIMFSRPEQENARDASRVETILSLAVIGIFSAYFVFAAFKYLDMFPLIEYRQWIFHGAQEPLIGAAPWSHLFDPQGDPGHFEIAFSRSLSLWTASLFGKVCGPTPVCHNSLHLAILVAEASLATLIVWNLSTSRALFPAVITWITILLSIPVFDAITWQATLLDKLAALFTALTLLIGSLVRIDDSRYKTAAPINAALLLTTFAAYNSKEAAFFLMPALVLLIAARAFAAGLTPGRIVRVTLILTIAPICYALLHIGLVLYNRTVLRPGEMNRVTGGNLLFNVEYYTRYLFDMIGTSISAIEIVGAGLFTLFLFAVVLSLVSGRWRNTPILMWAFLGLAGSLIIPMRTSSTSPFYLLVPLLYFGMLAGLMADAILRFFGLRSRFGLMLLFTGILVIRVVALQSALPLFDHLHDLSTNFQRTLAEVRADNEQTPSARILFVRSAEEPRTYMYASAPADAGDYALAPFLAPVGTSLADQQKFDLDKIKDVAAADVDKTKHPGDFVVFLAPDLSVARTERIPIR